MNILFLAICLCIAFFIQYILTFMQIKNFNVYYTKLRKIGKVAIGKRKGFFRAGAIILFAIDNDGNIIDGAYMQGVTILARFKTIKKFNYKNISMLSIEDCNEAKVSKSLTDAILDAKNNYNIITSGGEIPRVLSPFEKIGKALNIKNT